MEKVEDEEDKNVIHETCECCGNSIGNPNLATKTKTGLRCFRCEEALKL